MATDHASVTLMMQESHPLLQVTSRQDADRLANSKLVYEYIYLGQLEQLKEFLCKFQGGLHEVVDSEDWAGYTPLHLTTFSGPSDNLKVGKSSLRKCIAGELLKYANRTPGHVALLMTAVDGHGNTPLHHAAEYKRFDLIHLFLAYEANPRAKRVRDGLTPIHLIADGANRVVKNIVKSMLDVKVSVTTQDDHDSDAELVLEVALIAAQHSGARIIKYLQQEKELDLLAAGRDGCSVVHKCISGRLSFEDSFWTDLLSKSGNLVAQNDIGDSLLHTAARVGNPLALKQMHKNRVCIGDGGTRNKMGETPFHCVVQSGDGDESIQCLQMLLLIWREQKMPSIQREHLLAQDNLGQTPISKACDLKATRFLSELLNYKFDSLSFPWIDNQSLCLIYQTVPRVLLPFLDKNVEIDVDRKGELRVHVKFVYILGTDLQNPAKPWRLQDTTPLQNALHSPNNKQDVQKIMGHPVVKLFLYQKFKCFRCLAISWFLLQLLLAGVYNRLAILVVHGSVVKNETTTELCSEFCSGSPEYFLWSICLMTLAFIFLAKEVAQFVARPKKYLRSPLNYIQLVYLATCVTLQIEIGQILVATKTESELDNDGQIGVTAIGCFLSFFLVLREFGHIRCFAGFYEIFVQVVSTSSKVLLCYSPCLLAFTFAFRILLSDDEAFHLPYAFNKILSMTIGELNYEQISINRSFFVQSMYLMFAVLSAIVLINLLIAYTYADLQKLLLDADFSRRVNEMELVHSYESLVRILVPMFPSLEKRYFVSDFKLTVDSANLNRELLLEIRELLHTKVQMQKDTQQATAQSHGPPGNTVSAKNMCRLLN